MDWSLDLQRLCAIAEELGRGISWAKSLRHELYVIWGMSSMSFELYGSENCIDWVASCLLPLRNLFEFPLCKSSCEAIAALETNLKKTLFEGGEHYILLVSASYPALFCSGACLEGISLMLSLCAFLFSPMWMKICLSKENPYHALCGGVHFILQSLVTCHAITCVNFLLSY